MAYFLFVDESGHDQRHSPYEVLAGVAIHDSVLWQLVCDVQDAEREMFGGRISLGRDELKARKLLKAKTFRLAGQLSAIPNPRRTELAAAALTDGSNVTKEQLTALGQAKIDFCRRVLDICAKYGARAFATMVSKNAPRSVGGSLRKDYAYLFERFFYFIEDQDGSDQGIVVFDELERTRAHLLVDQMAEYFRRTEKGQVRADRIVPEPFFVHSDLTTGVQIADLVAYIICWNVRVHRMRAPRRAELNLLGQQVLRLRHRAVRDREGYPDGFVVWSFVPIDDLRPRSEQELDLEQSQLGE